MEKGYCEEEQTRTKTLQMNTVKVLSHHNCDTVSCGASVQIPTEKHPERSSFPFFLISTFGSGQQRQLKV